MRLEVFSRLVVWFGTKPQRAEKILKALEDAGVEE